jgi:hypothetical protein
VWKKQEEKDGNGGEGIADVPDHLRLHRHQEVLLVDWVCVVTCYVNSELVSRDFTTWNVSSQVALKILKCYTNVSLSYGFARWHTRSQRSKT